MSVQQVYTSANNIKKNDKLAASQKIEKSYVLAIGKTTICKKLIALMENRNFNFDGFYTEEIRNQNGGRIGFDVVPLKNLNGRSILARAGNLAGEVQNRGRRKPTIGNYCVFVDDFEKTALPIFDSNTDVLIIDEIGKMELLSEKFFEAVSKLFQTNSKLPFIIATVPLMSKVKNSRKYSSFFEEIHKDKRSIVITVNSQNRDKVPEQILQIIS